MKQEFNLTKIYAVLKEKGHKQQDLAKLLNISQVAVNKKLNGKTNFSINELEIIAKEYNKDISYFFTK